MADLSIVLCDPDQAYIRKLAAGLKKYFDFPVLLQVYSQAEEILPADNLLPGSIVLCGENVDVKADAQKACEGKYHFVRLCEEPTDRTGQEPFWEEEIYKYQPVFRIVEIIQRSFPEWQRNGYVRRMNSDQQWYGVFSPCRHESAIPFACSLAGELGEEKKVLVIFLAQFGGVAALLGLESASDTESFFLRLRDSKRNPGMDLIPEVLSMPGFDLLTEPENPEVLYELEESDMQMLISALENSGYEMVVWLAEETLRGIHLLFDRSTRLFCLEKTDTCSVCRQKEFERFCRKLPGDGTEKKLRHVSLPVYQQMECGWHLLWQWRQSAIGKAAKECLEEGDKDGE